MEREKEEAKIGKYVKQSCSLSPILFNLYIEYAIKELKKKFKAKVTAHADRIQMLRFAEDIELLTESTIDLGKILNDIENILSSVYGMKSDKGKTKIMAFDRCEYKELNIKIDNKKI